MPPEDLKKILALGVHAPSADNLQPWRFSVNDSRISVFAEPADASILVDQMSTLIGCGALIENLVIAARSLGYRAEVTYTSGTDSKHVADITFTKTGVVSDEALCAVIQKRTTNRKRFSKIRLTSEKRQAILASVLPFNDGVSIRITESRPAMRSLANSLAVNVRLFIEDRTFHDYFFDHLRFTDREQVATADGIPLPAMRLNSLERIEIKLMRSWKIAQFFSPFGVARLAGKTYTDRYMSAGAFISILTRQNSDADLLAGGRALERLWLTATHLGLGIQPITGFLIGQDARGLRGFDAVASPLQRDVRRAYAEIRETLGLGDETWLSPFVSGRPLPHQTRHCVRLRKLGNERYTGFNRMKIESGVARKDELEPVIALITRVYQKAGYVRPGEHSVISEFLDLPSTVTFTTRIENELVGTISVISDSPNGLPMDSGFNDSIAPFRSEGKTFAEVIQFAVDRDLVASYQAKYPLDAIDRTVSMALFKLVFHYALRKKLELLTITIAAKHQAFYRWMGFAPLTGSRNYSSVANMNTSVAMALDLERLKKDRAEGVSMNALMAEIFSNPATEELVAAALTHEKEPVLSWSNVWHLPAQILHNVFNGNDAN